MFLILLGVQSVQVRKTALKTITVLDKHFFPANIIAKQRSAITHLIQKPCPTNIRHFVVRLPKSNKYLEVFPGYEESKNMSEARVNGIILYNTPNSLSRYAYLQVFYFKTPYTKEIGMSERMYTTELI